MQARSTDDLLGGQTSFVLSTMRLDICVHGPWNKRHGARVSAASISTALQSQQQGTAQAVLFLSLPIQEYGGRGWHSRPCIRRAGKQNGFKFHNICMCTSDMDLESIKGNQQDKNGTSIRIDAPFANQVDGPTCSVSKKEQIFIRSSSWVMFGLFPSYCSCAQVALRYASCPR